MKILLCGANGRVGGEIVHLGSLFNINIIACTSSQLDITNRQDIATVIREIKPDIVINAAAYTDIDGAEVNQQLAYKINQDGSRFLAKFCGYLDIPLIHISTDYVFSGARNIAYSEDDPPNPINIYGKSKLAGELAIAAVWHKYVVIRSSWVFGQRGGSFVKTILKRAIAGLPLEVVTNEVGCPTSAIGLAHCILEIATQIYQGNLAWGIYHFCGSPEINRYQYAVDILTMAQKHYILKNNHIESIATTLGIAKRPCYSSLQTTRVFEVFKIQPDAWRTALGKLMPRLISDDKY